MSDVSRFHVCIVTDAGVPMHPFPSTAVTVYVVVLTGVTFCVAIEPVPVLHW